MTSTLTDLLFAGLILAVVQFLAALPWLYAADRKAFREALRSPQAIGTAALAVAFGAAAIAGVLRYTNDPATLDRIGRIYGSILQLQLTVDIVLLVLGVMLFLWPRGGTVAMATFREGYRQPMFWLIAGFTSVALVASMVIPYFTFGDDFKMMKQLGFDMIMLSAVLFSVLAASISISDEIEGRTAVTLMSKPVTRRQFLLGKYLGILLAGGLMVMLLAWVLNWVLYVKPYFDRLDDSADPLVTQVQAVLTPKLQSLGRGFAVQESLRGVAGWFAESFADALGHSLGFGQVMVLLAVAVSLATRMHFFINLMLCLLLFFLGHLAPALVAVTDQLRQSQQGGVAANLANFLAQLIDKVLPSLDFFNTSQVFIRETPLDLRGYAVYACSVFGYAFVYTVIALLGGLILFEDRDLA